MLQVPKTKLKSFEEGALPIQQGIVMESLPLELKCSLNIYGCKRHLRAYLSKKASFQNWMTFKYYFL